MFWAIILFLLFLLIGFGARWLFRQRSVEEMKTARERYPWLRGKRK
jgi:hypothetical protein